jgi:transcriptional regulator with XRE-family HTH domain
MSGVKCPRRLDNAKLSGHYVRTMPTLTELRKSTGRTRARVASDLDMSERHLQRLENGQSPISRVHALAFANYFEVSVDQIDGAETVAA